LSPFSGLQNKPSKIPAEAGLLFNYEDGSGMFFQNTGYSTNYTVLQHRRLYSSKGEKFGE
jgi:hypothetical protein